MPTPSEDGRNIGKDIAIQDETIRIGTSECLISKELQLECFITNISSYESTKSILTIGEPHSNAEAQFSLFRGLEFFFRDNPHLVGKTAFLAEGVPTNKSVSVRSLIEAEPHPSDELIKQTLSSFLITGYMAYEWKHQQGISIVGTEDQALYEMSREFATWCVENPNAPFADVYKMVTETTGKKFTIPVSGAWEYAVTVRNKQIAYTLIEKTRSYENPILFVGNGHLNRVMNDAKYALLKELAEMGPDGPFRKYANAVTGECENHSVFYYLQQAKIGYTTLEPFGFDSKREEMTYQKLFEAQRKGNLQGANIDYEGYVAFLLSKQRAKPDGSTTVEPNPDAAADFVKRLKEQQKQEAESGVIYEAPQEDNSKYHWFEISPVKVQETIHRDSLWNEESINSRGHDFETIRRANLGSNCPVVDDIVVDAMTATSMKSIDLTERSYQVGSGLDSTVRGYVDKLSEFTEGDWKDYHFERGVNFQDRYLELGIPAGKATRAQIENLLSLQDYAQTKDVRMVIVEVP